MKKLYFLILLTLISFSSFSQSAGDIVVTEFMNDSDAVNDSVGEWIELYNTTGSDIDLNGWSLKDDGSNLYEFTTSVIVPANSYFVMGVGPLDTTQNGGVNLDYSYGDGTYALANSDDEIVLLSPTDIEIDRVNYGINGFPDGGPGFSISLNPDKLTADNNIPSNWCLSSSVFGDGDKGTPGAVNDACAATCTASLGAHDATCDAKTAAEDTYTATLAFSGAGSSTYMVTTTAGIIEGDDPTSNESGNIIITGIPEGTDISVTIDDTADGGLCALSRTISSPVCIPTGSVDLELQGIIDFTVPSGGVDGKAIHVVATADIADLSEYGVGIANNGGGTDGQEYTFPAQAVSNGDHILVVRSAEAMETYFTTAGYGLFDHVFVDEEGGVGQNGDDAIELFKNGTVIETFGDINVDGSGESWDYVDSWAYKTTLGESWPSGWSYGGVECTDNSTTIFDSSCIYPFVASLSAEDTSIQTIGVYPNPISKSTQYLNLQSNSTLPMIITIYSIVGKQIDQQVIKNNLMNVSQLKSGIYLMKISQGQSIVNRKIVKQ